MLIHQYEKLTRPTLLACRSQVSKVPHLKDFELLTGLGLDANTMSTRLFESWDKVAEGHEPFYPG